MDAYERREADQLRTELADLRSRVDYIDRQGTRGEGALTARLALVVSELGEFKTALSTHAAFHERAEEKKRAEEKQLTRDKTVTRRWLIGIGFTAGGFIIAVLTLLLMLLGKIHGPA